MVEIVVDCYDFNLGQSRTNVQGKCRLELCGVLLGPGFKVQAGLAD